MDKNILQHYDVIMNILLNTEDKELLSLCLTNKKVNEVCSSQLFWKNRLIKQYGEDILSIKPDDMSYKIFYLRTLIVLDDWTNPISDMKIWWGGSLENSFCGTGGFGDLLPLSLDLRIKFKLEKELVKLEKINLVERVNIDDEDEFPYQTVEGYTVGSRKKKESFMNFEDIYKSLNPYVDYSKYLASIVSWMRYGSVLTDIDFIKMPKSSLPLLEVD